MKFKKGDKVQIRADLVEYNYYSMLNSDESNDVTEDMLKYCGKIVTIVVCEYRGYTIHEDGERWCWTDSMFEEFTCRAYNKNNTMFSR